MIGSDVSEPPPQLVAQLDRPFQQSAVAVEHVARIGFASGRTPHQQRQLAIRDRLLGQIVIDDQGVLALEHEVLGHRRAGIGRDVLQRRGAGGARHDHRRVVHRAVIVQRLDHAGHRRVLLADRHVEALHAGVFLVEDRVDGDGRLAGLAVADDQLALAAADRASWRRWP